MRANKRRVHTNRAKKLIRFFLFYDRDYVIRRFVHEHFHFPLGGMQILVLSFP